MRASRLLAASLLLAGASTACLAAARAPATAPPTTATTHALGVYVPPRPLLWKVSDGDNSIYLLGSFHALKKSDYPLSRAVDAAFADAEQVAFEIPPEEMASPSLATTMMQAALLPDGHSVHEQLDEGTWGRLQKWAVRNNMPVQNLQRFEPWFLSLLVSLGEMSKAGYEPKQGLDQQMMARLPGSNKRTLGLETGASQIAVLDGMSAVEQKQSLAESLDDAEDFRAHLDKLHEQWRRGDAEGLEKMLNTDFRVKYAALYQRIDVDRNQAWLPKLKAMLDGEKSDDTLVVVGAMHLLGQDGVVSLLRAAGYRVERL